jgi:hypothetical protein
MKKILLVVLLIVLSLLVFTFVFGFQEINFFRSRADVSQASFSVENSYLFVSPLQAPANGQEKIRVTVFVLNDQGLGVLGKNVSLSHDPKINIETILGATDNYGKAYFDVSSGNSGDYYLDVTIDGQKLVQKAHLIFY